MNSSFEFLCHFRQKLKKDFQLTKIYLKFNSIVEMKIHLNLIIIFLNGMAAYCASIHNLHISTKLHTIDIFFVKIFEHKSKLRSKVRPKNNQFKFQHKQFIQASYNRFFFVNDNNKNSNFCGYHEFNSFNIEMFGR